MSKNKPKISKQVGKFTEQQWSAIRRLETALEFLKKRDLQIYTKKGRVVISKKYGYADEVEMRSPVIIADDCWDEL